MTKNSNPFIYLFKTQFVYNVKWMDAVLLFFYFKIHKFNPLSIYFFLFITIQEFSTNFSYPQIIHPFIPLLPGKLTNKFKNTRYTISSHSDVSKLFSVHKLPILISKHKKQHTKPGQFLLSKKRDTISQQRFL